MEIITSTKNSFDPTPSLKSSPIQISFVPFDINSTICDCGHIYSETLLSQKFCKNCLFEYIKHITNFDTYLDIHGSIHSNTLNIEEQFEEWLKCSYFKQIVTTRSEIFNFYETCKSCGYGCSNIICSNCYLITFVWAESTTSVPILHLPWWDAYNQCVICDQLLKSESDCQKWCSNCYVVYIGCRYCLTTNIIFGITEKSQCMKCKRILSITSINIPNIKNIIEYYLIFNANSFNQIANYVKNIDKHSNLLETYSFIKKLNYFPLIFLYSHIANLRENNDYLNTTIPIMFIPINNNAHYCYYCKKVYSETLLFKQKYCKNCLFLCIKYATSNLDIKWAIDNLDVCLSTTNTDCSKHEPRDLNFCSQEWCENCTEILYFKQIVVNKKFDFNNIEHFYEKNCRLCGKLIYKENDINEFKLCPSCYLISLKFVESALVVKECIPILHLPWWDACDKCVICNRLLEFKSDCQKWCLNCLVIYTGCRYCLTTNIIFGITEQSQCMKCKRVSSINIINISPDMKNIIGIYLKLNTHSFNQIANYVKNIDKHFNLLETYSFIKKLNYFPLIFLYSHIANLRENNDYLNTTIPIMFIPFNNNAVFCYYCNKVYSETFLFKQKYCEYCLYLCISYATSNLNIKCAIDNLDVCSSTTNTDCNNEHEPRNLNFNIQKWYKNYPEILYFKQIVINKKFDFNNIEHFYEKNCRLCGKLIYKENKEIGIMEFELCSNCYLISFEFIESTLTKKHVPILHLPWWDAYDECIICDSELQFSSNCQKWCSHCLIVYTECSYCLTTNIIFGIIEKSQCMKCKRISSITSINIPNMKNNIEYFLKFNTYSFNQIANYVKNIDKHSNLLGIYSFIKKSNYFSYNDLHFYIKYLGENNEDYLNTTIPIMFILFNNNENYCYCCKKVYSRTLLFKQKYCKNCLSLCIKCATSNLDIKCAIDNLDICLSTTNTDCSKHKPIDLDFCSQKWCENCSEILYFNQIVVDQQLDLSNIEHFYEQCRLCGKLIYKENKEVVIMKFKLCSNCYLISFEFIESTLTKKHVPILYLPWWDAYDECIICDSKLKFLSNCQKWCSHCLTVYTGCSYCLTTNIIFGFANQSQCKKCKRIIVINAISISGNYNIDEFLYFTKVKINHIENCVNNISNNNSNPLDIYKNNFASRHIIKWIPYSQITNLKEIAEGGHGKIYKASINDNIVAIKEFLNSQDLSKYFLNEVIL
jgi:hypothetical protein